MRAKIGCILTDFKRTRRELLRRKIAYIRYLFILRACVCNLALLLTKVKTPFQVVKYIGKNRQKRTILERKINI